MRAWLVAALWAAAVAALVVGIGMRVSAARAADPALTLRGFLSTVPPEVAAAARVVQRTRGQIQVEVDLDHVWARRLAASNGFAPIDGQLIGIAAERWILERDGAPRGTVLLHAPIGAGPVIITFIPADP